MYYTTSPEFDRAIMTDEDKTENPMLRVEITLAEYRQLAMDCGKYEAMFEKLNGDLKLYKQKYYDLLTATANRTFAQERDLDELIRDWSVRKHA